MNSTCSAHMHADDRTQPRLFFLHIPKTAGTTLWLIMMRQYSPERVLRIDERSQFEALDRRTLEDAYAVVGHLPFGAQAALPFAAACITLLREPIGCIYSYYEHVCRRPDAELAADWFNDLGDRLSLAECFRRGLRELDNPQTRLLAGPDALALPFGTCDENVLAKAKQNLIDGVAVAGLTERFDEFLLVLQNRFHWSAPYYSKENTRTSRKARVEESEDAADLVHKYTRWDQALYSFTAARFDELLSRQDFDVSESLARFQRANRRYQWVKRLGTENWIGGLKHRLPLRQQQVLERMMRMALS